MSLQQVRGSQIILSAEFLQECSYVDWAGALGVEETFVVNARNRDLGDDQGLNKNTLKLDLFNKEGLSRQWLDNSRLLHVRMRYRRAGSAVWSWALNSTSGILNAVGKESPYGKEGGGLRGRRLPQLQQPRLFLHP